MAPTPDSASAERAHVAAPAPGLDARERARAVFGSTWRQTNWSLVAPFLVVGSLGLGALAGVAPIVVLAALAAFLMVALVLANLALGLAVFVVVQFFALLPFFSGQQLTVIKLTGALLAISWIIVIVRAKASRSGPTLGKGLLYHHPTLAVLLLLFLVWGGLSYLWAIQPASVFPDLERYALNFVLVAIIFTAIRTPLHAVWIAGALALGTAIGTAASSLFTSANDPERLAGAVGDPNDLAAALVPGVLLSVALAGTLRSRAWRLAFLAAALVGLVGLFLTASRGGLIALAAAMIVWVIFGGRWRRWLAIVLGLGVVGAIGYYRFAAPAGLAARISAAGDGSGRLDIWRLGWRVFDDRPWLGAGMGNFTVSTPQYLVEPGLVARADRIITTPKIAHNMYLSMLTELGMVGFGLFVAIIIVCLVLMFKAIRIFATTENRLMDVLCRAYFASLCGLLVADFFLSGQYEKHLWLLLGMGPALLMIARRESAAERAVGAVPAPRQARVG